MKSAQRYGALRKASIKSLQAFEAAYLHKSFAEAAKELSITASAVSHSIQVLEETLGTLLFERVKRASFPLRRASDCTPLWVALSVESMPRCGHSWIKRTCRKSSPSSVRLALPQYG